jgi:predicted  nucleic acid-binding Zn-ribbon protein
MLSDYALWNYTQERGKTELEFVLAERLHALNDEVAELEAAQVAIEDLQNEMAALQNDIDELQAHIDATRGYGPDK